MSFPNKYAGKCNDCGAAVGPLKGTCSRSGSAWVTTCVACAASLPAAVVAPTTVVVRLAGHAVVLTTTGRLNDAQFAAYRAATAGGTYRDRANTLRADQAATALASLATVEGLILDVEPSVRALLDASAAEHAAALTGAAERTAAVEAVLAATGRSLYPYQREGVAWLASRSSALLADDMGLGKTIQALTAVPAGVGVIVVCPAVAKSVWRDEAARWRTDLRSTVLAGRGALRAPAAGEMVVVNYDILSDEIPALLAGTVLILDEAHAVANSKSARTKRVRALSEAVRAVGGRVYVLTATPLKNRPTELWSVLEAGGLAREAFGSWRGFRDAFNGTEDSWGGTVWGEPSDAVPAMLRRVMLRRVKADVLTDLPAKTHRALPVALTGAVVKACDAAVAEMGGEDALDSAIAAQADGEDVLSFRKMSAARAALSSAKIPAMLSVVEAHEESGTPLVVFSAYRAPVDLLAAREGWASITGDTSDAARSEIVARFQSGALKGLACTIRAGGVAITLTHASNVLRVDREWNPALNVQAEDRCYRIGQRAAVLVTDLVADHPLDRRMAVVLSAKESLISASVEAATVQHIAPRSAPASIDWSALEDAASAALTAAETARIAAEQYAEGRARTLAVRRAEVLRTEGREKVRAAAARRLGEEQSEEDAPRFAPRTEVEAWALSALGQLAAMDPDRAKELNGVGFSASDGSFGHALASIGRVDGLTAQEWRIAVRMACHYPAQVGRAPVRAEAA